MFQLEIDGFSGPLDLLCHMVESREIEAASISVSQVIALYGAWLTAHGNISITDLATFISQAARLMLHKTKALLPRFDEPSLEEGEDLYEEDPELTLDQFLERYRPWRIATERLTTCFQQAAQRHFRVSESRPLVYDLGDLYSLSLQWLELLRRRKASQADQMDLLDDSWEIEGVPQAIPDETHVERRIERIMERLSLETEGTSLALLLQNEPGRSALVVTLLALLEMARRNRISLIQKELFGDVLIQPQEM